MTLVSNIPFIETSRDIMIKKKNFVWPNHQVDGAIKRHVLCGLNRCLACMNMHICVYEYECRAAKPQESKTKFYTTSEMFGVLYQVLLKQMV